MSKIGKRPILVPEEIETKIADNEATFSKGDKTLSVALPADLKVEVKDAKIIVTRKNDSKSAKEKHGLIASLIKNAITGIKEGFNKELTFTGTGYRVAVTGKTLVLNMGYSHEIKIEIPEDLDVKVVKNTITVSGIDKARVGQLAAKIREVRPPEVYKGKGIKYIDEHIRRKAGKTAASK